LEVLKDKENEIFIPQVEAVLMLAVDFDEVDFTIPLVQTPEDVVFANSVFKKAKEKLEEEGKDFKKDMDFGIMIETSNAVKNIAAFAEAGVKSFSVGQNDLTCFCLGIKPQEFETGKHDLHPSPLRLAGRVIKNLPPRFFEADPAKEKHFPVSNCGNLAGNPLGAVILIGKGFRKLSMAPDQIINVKRVIRDTPIDVMQKVAGEVDDCDTWDEVRDHVRKRMNELAGVDLNQRKYKI